MEKQEKKENSLTKEEKTVVARLDNINDTGQMYELASILCKSGLVPATHNTPEKAIICIAQGRELGLGAVTSLYNMYFISGKPVLSVHAINALVTSKGVAFKTIRDYEKVFDNPDDPEDFDRVTTIKFFRNHPQLNMVIEEIVEYSMKEAVKAGLATKETWLKYPKILLWNRTFTFGARRIASDVLLGVMEVSEAGDTFKKAYSLDDEGNAEFTEIK